MKKVLVISFQSLTKTNVGGTGKLAYYIAQQLSTENHLAFLVVSSKGKFETPFPSKAVAGLSKYYLWILNRALSFKLIPSYLERHLEEMLYDYFCQKHVSNDIGLIISTNPFLKKTLRKAALKGIKTVLIPGNPADGLICEKILEEKKQWHVDGDDAYTFKPRLSYFEKSVERYDLIICHSSVIENTFKEKYPAGNIKKCYGMLWPGKIEQSALRGRSEKFVVLYVAFTVLLKGLQYLLSAWQMLKDDESELWIVGTIDPMVKKLIEREFENIKNVKYFGVQRTLSPFYTQARLFVAPSLIEGGPVSALEAMSHKVPVLITESCGVRDIIQNGENGLIVPIRDSDAIANKIEWGRKNRKNLEDLGSAGYDTIQQLNFDNFIKGLIEGATKKTNFE